MAGNSDKKIEIFVAEFIKTGNRRQSAITAGYAERSADVAASRLLKKDKVLALLKQKQAGFAQKLDISVERVLKERARLAFYDPRKFFDKQGNPIPVHELDDDTAAVVAGLEVLEEFSGRGEDRVLVGYTKKIKLADKDKSLTALEKHLGMYSDDSNKSAILNIHLHLE